MSKNPNGMLSRGNKEWGSKARKEEDHLRGHRRRGKVEAIHEQAGAHVVEADRMSIPLNQSQFVYALHPGDKPLNHMNDIVDDPAEASEREAAINRVMAHPPVVRNYGWDPSKHWEK